jgi:hypothetical protein
MRWSTMSKKDRRAIIFGAAILSPALVYVWGVKPYRARLTDARDQLEVASKTLARERAAVIIRRANPDAQRAADSALAAVTSRLFVGRDDAIASSQLAAYLGDVARRNRVLLQDAGTRPSSTSPDGIRTLRVEIRAESDIQGVVKFLQALEGGSKLVRVDRLDISKTSDLEDNRNFETLNIAATIAGFAFVAPGDSTNRSAKPSRGAP